MNNNEIQVYREIQKNTEMAIKAIEAISDKVYDDDLALQIAKQELKYSDIRNQAVNKIIEKKAEPYQENHVSNFMLTSSIKMNTMLNTSTSHIAEMMIQGSNRGITDMCKALNRYAVDGSASSEMAKELMDFEEKNIERLKKYL